MTGYFEIISASSTHIYHSALVFAPKTSIVRKLYEAHAHPFVRVVHGASTLWDSNIAATTLPSTISRAVWSQCSRLIAITRGDTMTVDVLDSSTLQRLQTLEFAQLQRTLPHSMALVFSPDGRMLTCFSYNICDVLETFLISWDLQTGGVVSLIRHEKPGSLLVGKPSIAYSKNGQMVGAFHWYHSASMIYIYDIISGVHTHSHLLGSPFLSVGPISNDIWTHGESFRFVTAGPATMTIWEVGFAPGAAPTDFETLPIPMDVRSAVLSDITVDELTGRVRFLPTSHRLAIVHNKKVLVWDTRNYKSMLSCTDTSVCPRMSFSSDGHFFAYSTTQSEIYLWKESHTGYILYEKFTSRAEHPTPLLSPSGNSIVGFGDRTIQLWHTKGFTTALPHISTPVPQHTANFVLDFSADGLLAAVARKWDNMVTVLDVKSGVSQLTINAGVDVCGLRFIGSTVAVIGGDGRVTTWNLPAGDPVPNVSVKIRDLPWLLTVESRYQRRVAAVSVSPDLRHIAVTWPGGRIRAMHIYRTSTGECLAEIRTKGHTPWFSPDGRSVWCLGDTIAPAVWTIPEDMPLNEPSGFSPKHPPEGYPWVSSQGYQITDDGWVLSPDGKRLSMLPPPWRSYPVRRVWNGRFVALLHGGLSEPVILELEP